MRWDELYDSPRPEPNIGGCTTLDLEDARLGEAEVTSVLAAITANMSLVDDLRHLRLGGIDLRPEPVMTPLTALVAASTSLSSLSVARGNLIAGAAAPLILAARRHASLARLELEWNELGDAGATALATEVLAVGDAGALTTLRLQRNGVGDVGGAALGDALRSNSVLRSLQLEGNGIGPAGAAAIAAGLAENEALTHLGMELNPIGAEGARLIGQVGPPQPLSSSAASHLGSLDPRTHAPATPVSSPLQTQPWTDSLSSVLPAVAAAAIVANCQRAAARVLVQRLRRRRRRHHRDRLGAARQRAAAGAFACA